LNTAKNKSELKYDDVDWHVGGDFPEDLDVHAARTHIGIFLGWAVTRGLESEMLRSTYPDTLEALRNGKLKGSDVLMQCCDDKITNDDFSDIGNSFAKDYYEANYLDDYVDLSDDNLFSIYHEPDTQEKFNKICDLLDKRYSDWKTKNGIT